MMANNQALILKGGVYRGTPHSFFLLCVVLFWILVVIVNCFILLFEMCSLVLFCACVFWFSPHKQ